MLTKGNWKVACRYGEWMKVSRNRVRSPSRRSQARDVDDHGTDERSANQQQVDDTAMTAKNSGRG